MYVFPQCLLRVLNPFRFLLSNVWPAGCCPLGWSSLLTPPYILLQALSLLFRTTKLFLVGNLERRTSSKLLNTKYVFTSQPLTNQFDDFGNIFSLHVSPSLASHFILLFSSGAVGVCDLQGELDKSWYGTPRENCFAKLVRSLKAKDSTPKKSKVQQASILWSAVQSQNDSKDLILTYIEKQDASTTLHVLKINSLLDISHVTSQELDAKSSVLITASFDAESRTLATYCMHLLLPFPSANNNNLMRRWQLNHPQLTLFPLPSIMTLITITIMITLFSSVPTS